ncbi:MAG: PHP domain-containing protein [bacterium]
MIDEERLIELLNKTAKLLEFVDENKFKILAYSNGAEIIESYDGKFFELYNSGAYKNVKGIGKGLQEFIKEFAETNSVLIYEQLLDKAPVGIFDMLKIKGLGLKKIKNIYESLNIQTFEQLEQACISGKILEVKGITEKFVKDILEEINRIKKDRNKLLLSKALLMAENLINYLIVNPLIIKVETVGQLCRNMEVISKSEIIVYLNTDANFIDIIKNKYVVTSVSSFEKYEEYELLVGSSNHITVYLCNSIERYNYTKFVKTGSTQFLEKYFGGLDAENFQNENDYFNSHNLTFLNYEVREVEALPYINKLELNSNLTKENIKGLIHFHTTYSDGIATPEEMIAESVINGLIYNVISDHSKSAFYANGLNEDRLLKQREHINRLTKTDGTYIFQGIESDIIADGNLDYDNTILKELDFVIASVHSRFDMSKEEMTNRIIKAIENPYTDVIGHVTGRVLLRRKPYELDIYKILDACVQNDVAIEINSAPSRLDLDWRNIYYAREKGCKFCINPDAHATSEIQVIQYGVKIARKGGIQINDVINCFDVDDFISYINRKVTRKFNRRQYGIERIN